MKGRHVKETINEKAFFIMNGFCFIIWEILPINTGRADKVNTEKEEFTDERLVVIVLVLWGWASLG